MNTVNMDKNISYGFWLI